jgi:NhaC family Na+:H+ antiporter
MRNANHEPLTKNTAAFRSNRVKNRHRKEPSLRGALAVLGTLGALFIGGAAVFRINIVVLLALGGIFTTAVFRGYYGFGWRELFLDGVLPLVGRAGSAMGVLLCVGPLISTWMLSGTIPYLMWLGISLLTPSSFLPTAFLLCCFASVITGTSWGTAGTFGVALTCIAQALGVPSAATAGAIVAGAYFGDKLSPVSDTTLLAAAVAGVDVMDHIRSMLWTTLPGFFLAILLYTFAPGGEGGSSAHGDAVRQGLERSFFLHPVLLLPPLLLLVLAWLRVRVLLALAAAVAAAIPFALLQGYGLADILTGMFAGPGISSGNPALDELLGRGGILFLAGVVVVVCIAYVFAGQLEVTGTFRRIGDALKERFIGTRKGRFVFSLSLVGIATAFGTGNSYLCAILPGGMFKELGDRIGVPRLVLSRTLEDSGTVVAPIVPWSAAAIYMSSVLGVETLDYLLWAPVCYLGFPAAWCYGFASDRKRKKKNISSGLPESDGDREDGE